MKSDNKSVAAKDTRKNERLSRLGILSEPAGYVDGQNLYEYVTSNPGSQVDPLGLLQQTAGPTTKPSSGGGSPTTGPTTQPTTNPTYKPVPPQGPNGWGNSIVINKSKDPIVIWNTGGYGVLPPGQGTNPKGDEGDWVLKWGTWYKVGPNVCIVEDDKIPYRQDETGETAGGPLPAGPQGGLFSDPWEPPKKPNPSDLLVSPTGGAQK